MAGRRWSLHAITINANNVTIDCNDFKIGGLAAGNASLANGIYADNRQNATVWHCIVRGFYYGISLDGGAGHLVEDNRLDNNLRVGINVSGENNRVQRNRVYDTGGAPHDYRSWGIVGYADVIENTVAGVFSTYANAMVIGIYARGRGYVTRNRVHELVATGSGTAYGITENSSGARVADNHVSATAMTAGDGIDGGNANTFCTGNTVVNFSIAYADCTRSLDNLTLP
ncbi:right-handed parallel beta-helix repeat-containing protein [Luteimonas mephitis]|uniref:right-handed parallel beta-helix repeat-containing protein n=1 Tax=Luteimonas mephitis TaxID=83615 RepID=UPI000415C970|nr:right-handed parallel beta-helix repeat-containing protein [Luteimonas mephitis]